ncbi:copper chaperone PCu(A)C [Breoghania sp.]|uniref:copper chaperone PCu(A)C n=1 Tax=Breoghania sp. TaxID=2065378 RepID=UPI00260FCCEA|nr:copper chaperone PCu(A)C [Breoghania sp.]MDJ0932366.1 copper chaperone PCu(A)C [Breoghania sp.]
MKTLFSFAAAAALSLTFAAQAEPAPITAGDLKIEMPWTRVTPGKAAAGGGFLKITNTGTEADRLVGAFSPRSKRTEIHEMTVKDGIMVMRQVKGGLEIPAGGTLELKPGSYHVMFMGLPEPFKEGEMIPVTLTFEKTGDVELKLMVQKPGGGKNPAHSVEMDHGHMDHDNKKMK